MNSYNKIMLYFWLALGIVGMVYTTFLCITGGFRSYSFYYIPVLIAFMMFFFKRWMMKRFEKHSAFLEEQQKGK